jgi:hypothetical protein
MDPQQEAIRRTPSSTKLQLALLSLTFARFKLAETHIFIHAFLVAQSLPKSAAALTKELNKATANLGNEVEEESKDCSGKELVPLVRAKIDIEKAK